MANTIDRPPFYMRIDAALERRTKLAAAIEALREEAIHKRVASDMDELVRALRGGDMAEQFVQEESKAAWLPLILRGAEGEISAEEFKLLIRDVSFAAEDQMSRWRSLAYPFVLMGSAIIVFVLLSTTVIPNFKKMFDDFALKTPAATELVFSASSMINEQPVSFCFTLLGIVLGVWILRKLVSNLMTRGEASWFLGSLTAGNTKSVKAMGRFTSTLAELLSIDAPMSEALIIAGRASQNRRFFNAAGILAKDIDLSGKFSWTSPVLHNFPTLVVKAMGVGPNGGPSIPLLRQISAIYLDRVRQRFSWSVGLLGPFTIIGVGICVAFVVVALFMPLISLITGLS